MSHVLAGPRLGSAADQREALDQEGLAGVERDPPGGDRSGCVEAAAGLAPGSGRPRGRRGATRAPAGARAGASAPGRAAARRGPAASRSGSRCGAAPRRPRPRLDGHRPDVDDDRVGHVVVPAAPLPAAVHRPRSRRGWPPRARRWAAPRRPAPACAAARAEPDRRTVPWWTTRRPSAALPGEVPLQPEQHGEAGPTSTTATTTTRPRPQGWPAAISTVRPPRPRPAGRGSRRSAGPGRTRRSVGPARRAGRSACGGSTEAVTARQGFVTWMVTPSPRSMTAPGISWTAMPGWRSSGASPGCTSDGAVGGAEVGGHGATRGRPPSRGGSRGGWRRSPAAGLGTVTSRGCSSAVNRRASGARPTSTARSTSTVSPVENTSRATGRRSDDAGLPAGWPRDCPGLPVVVGPPGVELGSPAPGQAVVVGAAGRRVAGGPGGSASWGSDRSSARTDGAGSASASDRRLERRPADLELAPHADRRPFPDGSRSVDSVRPARPRCRVRLDRRPSTEPDRR